MSQRWDSNGNGYSFKKTALTSLFEQLKATVAIDRHPTGDPAPSEADMQVTRQLREASEALDIHLLDHVVMGTVSADPIGTGFYSFRAAGLI